VHKCGVSGAAGVRTSEGVLPAHLCNAPDRADNLTALTRWEQHHPGPDTHWCPLCRTRVEPLWMLVPNTAELVAYHLNGLARHAVTSTGHQKTPATPDRETIYLKNGQFATTDMPV
jgi:hypothetical protein